MSYFYNWQKPLKRAKAYVEHDSYGSQSAKFGLIML